MTDEKIIAVVSATGARLRDFATWLAANRDTFMGVER